MSADLGEADLTGTSDLRGVDLSAAHLVKANLNLVNLCEADFRLASLIWADLHRAILARADLSQAELGEANLSSANLNHANLSGADCRKANFSGANLSSRGAQFFAPLQPVPVLLVFAASFFLAAYRNQMRHFPVSIIGG